MNSKPSEREFWLILGVVLFGVIVFLLSSNNHQQSQIIPEQYQLEINRDQNGGSNRVSELNQKQKWIPMRARQMRDALTGIVVEETADEKIINAHHLILPPEFSTPEKKAAIADYLRETDIALAEHSKIPRPIPPPEMNSNVPTMEDAVKFDEYAKRQAENAEEVRKVLPMIDIHRAGKAEADLRAALGDGGFEKFQRLRDVQTGHFAETLRRAGVPEERIRASVSLIHEKNKASEKTFTREEEAFMTRTLGTTRIFGREMMVWPEIRAYANYLINPDR